MGWIPFDTVPGYEENIVYQLPEDGDPAENENGTTYTGQDQTPQQNQTDISQEPQDDHSQRIFVQSVLLALAALVLVCLAAMVLRTVLLRRRLKQQRRRFEDPDGRMACQAHAQRPAPAADGLAAGSVERGIPPAGRRP